MSFTEGYNRIARVYDKLNSEIDYTAWAKFVNECIERFMDEKPSLVLDLACGTGSMTYKLAELGYDMIGVDGSEDMLSEAYARGTSVGDTNILYLLQDMRSFELYGTVGAVTCCLDSINYLIGDGDMEKCFKTVHNYLEPNGVFIFDMNTPYRFENVYADNSYILEDKIDGKDVYCGWQNYYDKNSRICSFYLTLFEEGENGYFRSDEEQHERCYSMEEIKSTLEKCGFELLCVCSDYNFTEIDENTERWYFVAKRI
jgi:ubiquinone/menaquinone biosynthesis C-methylase UbiE